MKGRFLKTYAPFIPTASFDYHWGYHALVVWLAWLLNQTEPHALTELVLHFGQILNALTALVFYASGRELFGNSQAGLFSAMLASLVSWFPAYYVTWGRYTHLSAVLLLLIFGLVLWRLHAKPSLAHWLMSAILGSSLVIVHIPIAAFALTLALVLACILLIKRAWLSLGLWILAGMAAFFLVLPWLLILLDGRQFEQATDVAANLGGVQWLSGLTNSLAFCFGCLIIRNS